MKGEFAIFFGCIVAVVWIIFGPHRDRRRHRDRDTAERRETDAQVAATLDSLEERVKVLERIVTDDRADLRRQFRDLQD